MFLSDSTNVTRPVTDTKHIILPASSVKFEDSVRLVHDLIQRAHPLVETQIAVSELFGLWGLVEGLQSDAAENCKRIWLCFCPSE